MGEGADESEIDDLTSATVFNVLLRQWTIGITMVEKTYTVLWGNSGISKIMAFPSRTLSQTLNVADISFRRQGTSTVVCDVEMTGRPRFHGGLLPRWARSGHG